MVRQQAFNNINEYISGFPNEVQAVLQEIRSTIKKAVPGAGEKISYDIPTFTLDGNDLVGIAGWQKHVSLYPAPRRSPELMKAVAPYLSGAATVKMPLNQPIPYDLIIRIVKFRESE